ASGVSTAFMGLNINKSSIAVDLKHPRGKEVLEKLAGWADILVENFRAGVLESLGLGAERLRQINPRLIHTSVTAFGSQGPRSQEPGYEALMQAFTGVMELTGHPEGEPARSGVSILDMSTGITAALASVSALLLRERTGRGCHAETSLLHTALGLMTPQVSAYLMAGAEPRRLGTAHPSIVPYQAFRAAGGSLFIAAGNQKLWERLCRALERDDLAADERFRDNPSRVSNRRECLEELSREISRWDVERLLAALKKAGVPAGRVNRLPETLDDPQVEAAGVLEELHDPLLGTLRVPGLPLRLDGKGGTIHSRPPFLGEHTRGVLGMIGFNSGEIEELFHLGAVGGG
ncbi:MAG: CoA transferase, partial [Deltaproteobacteria bacterium]|nr:CoA transferase [Deltaproteobacteria bacterium]